MIFFDVFLALWLSLAITTFLYILYNFFNALNLYKKLHQSDPKFSFIFWLYYVTIIFSVCLLVAPFAFLNVSNKKQKLFNELYSLIEKHEKLKEKNE